MATQSQLSHEQALELLPWHVNATLESALSEQVAAPLEGCPECQQESALLASVVVSVNTEAPVANNADARFARLLQRVRQYEDRTPSATPSAAPGLGERLRAWLTAPTLSPRWATAFGLGLAVGLSALLFSLQPPESGGPAQYEVHASTEAAPLRLVVEFAGPPDARLLEELERSVGRNIDWHSQAPMRYVIELPGETTVETVADLRSDLLASDAVTYVTVETTRPR